MPKTNNNKRIIKINSLYVTNNNKSIEIMDTYKTFYSIIPDDECPLIVGKNYYNNINKNNSFRLL